MARIKGPTSDAHTGRPKEGQRLINPGVESGSTVIFKDYQTFRDRLSSFQYGRAGTSTHRAFEESLCALEEGEGATLAPSGLAACTLAISAYAKKDAHILITDSSYDPTRDFCTHYLNPLGIEVEYYDPRIGSGIAELIKPNTTVIYCETPGSLTFELQDIPAIINAAGNIPVIVDNTYAAGVFFKPLNFGAAMTIQAVTKYIGGHSDLLMGAVIANGEALKRLRKTARLLGLSVSARDVSLAHRGLRTLHRRLEIHHQTALEIARWLETQDQVARVIHPGLESHPDHAIWKRDFTGSNGLFSFIADWEDDARTERFLSALQLHGLGYSWGGFESLCVPFWPDKYRSATRWSEKRQLFRLHSGLENPADLVQDLQRGFEASRQK